MRQLSIGTGRWNVHWKQLALLGGGGPGDFAFVVAVAVDGRLRTDGLFPFDGA